MIKIKTSEGLIWKKLNIGGEEISYSPISVVDETLQDCTPEGQPLTKKQLQRAEYKFYTPDGKEYSGEKFKLVDGKVVNKTSITKSVTKENVQEIDKDVFSDIVAEHEYLLSASPSFTEKLRKTGKALKFNFNSGYGYRPQTAVVVFDELTDSLIMRTGRTKRSLIISRINAGQSAKDILKNLKSKSSVAEIEVATEV